jgi:alpha-ketoglutarate-dependent taurine dioxygenase
LVTGFDKESEQAITELNALIAKTSVEVHNQANSVLILNNKKAVHARSAFDPRFDGTDRWLQSAFVSKTPLPNGHVIDIQDRRGLDVPSHAKTTARDDILAY